LRDVPSSRTSVNLEPLKTKGLIVIDFKTPANVRRRWPS
jgi:hypothetical protein